MRVLLHRLAALASLAIVAGCVSVDPRTWSEKVDPEASKDFTGVYSVHPNYASNEATQKHGHLRDHLKFGWDSRDKKSIYAVRLQHEANGDLTFIWQAEGREVKPDVMSARNGWKRLDDGSFILDPEGGFLPNSVGDPASFGYNKHTIRFFRNAKGDLVVQRSDNAGGAFLIVPVVIIARELSIYPRKP